MIGKILLREADEKGRILISEFQEKEVYLVNLGSGYFVTNNKSVAEKIAENASKAFEEEFLKLVEELGISAESGEDFRKRDIKGSFVKKLPSRYRYNLR